MALVLPHEVWRDQVVSNLGVCDVSRVRSSSRPSGTSVIGCDFILRRIDALLRRYGLSGLIDVDRHGGAAGAAPLPGGLSRIDYLCPRAVSAGAWWPSLSLAVYKTIGHLLSYQGDSLALTTDEQTGENGEDGGPDESSGENEDRQEGEVAEPIEQDGDEQDDLMESVPDQGQHEPPLPPCPSASEYDTWHWCRSGAPPSQEGDDESDESDESYESDDSDDHHNYPHKVGDVRFCILPTDEAPGNQPYDTDDPAVEEDGVFRYSSSSAFMTDNLMCYWSGREGAEDEAAGDQEILMASVPRNDARLRSLMATEAFGDCIVADTHDEDGGDLPLGRTVVLCGHRSNETVAAHLRVARWSTHIDIEIFTTEGCVGGGVSVDECYPITVRHARDVLRRVRLEREVVDQGRRMDDDDDDDE
ncbi:unnamed protein product [Vitrella brassicaformis CCMP3155]|uniref:Uncharacterized protein n=1 Tax=Vitrella brassicaformis (strain CCMP3155) TaxID=1169540 RepID=A0A0G4FJI0_VITBC|nr:unnamed protein product [Vitrella brassicaformis CCMP3155]|eukprot:CEM13907.1 unnamed protein product [Vitrella brassicaformis CCMP3155]